MMLLWLGLALFIGVHLLPASTALRESAVTTLGEKGYKIAFSLVSVIGLVLIVIGFSNREYIPVGTGEPPVWATHLAATVMPIVFILLAAANMKGRIRKITRHPMMIGVLLWSVVHLIANPDHVSYVLFGSFAAFSILSILSAEMRGKRAVIETPLMKHDLIAIGGGLLVFIVVFGLHGVLFGVMPSFG